MHKKTFFSAFFSFFIFFSSLIFSESQIQKTEYTFISENQDEDGTPSTVKNSFVMIKIPGRNYALSQTEITQSLYEAVMQDNPSCSGSGCENPPVDSVTFFDAVTFCNNLSLLLGKEPVYSLDGAKETDKWDFSTSRNLTQDLNADGFRLPTAEEWEFAARGNTDFKYAGSDNLDEVAWYSKNSNFKTHDVATKKPNSFELYDMCGNVWEWCWDYYKDDSFFRIRKGGAQSSSKELCDISFNAGHYPSRNQPCYSYFNFGFRIAQTVKTSG